ncbi:5-Enolpyruvylshikimate-3-phosphate synthase [Chitinispirillum alkaliphilum]|nr:5-Enolpyruvylshikimate-3-phosphate synthase [Chitinispirillum alkaliphilum]
MLRLQPAKSISGKYDLPPSTDLLYLSALAGCAGGLTLKFPHVPSTPLTQEIKKSLEGMVTIDCTDTAWTLTPIQDDPAVFLRIPEALFPYQEYFLFIGLGMGKTVHVQGASEKRIQNWIEKAKHVGIICQTVMLDQSTAIQCQEFTPETTLDKEVQEEYAGLLISFLFGARKAHTFLLNSFFSNPLRPIISALGFKLKLKNLTPTEQEEDLLAKRIRFLQSRKKTEPNQKQTNSVEADFTKSRFSSEVEIRVPGDETLAAVLIVAKCLIPRGAFVIGNVPLESWNTQILNFARKAGCKFTIQEKPRSSYGANGLITLQKHDLNGRKMHCSPLYQFKASLPGMIILASFAQAQSVFRGLEDFRLDTPDGIDVLEKCIRLLGARHGEMPDGIVLEGSKYLDGFDLTEPLPPHISGAMVAAGLRCMGETTVCDELILRRWPDFQNLISSVCEFRSRNTKKEEKKA